MLTYQKAMKMNIPVVLIKSCNRQLCIMNLANFPISKLVRYENPELFKKIQVTFDLNLFFLETSNETLPNSAKSRCNCAPVPPVGLSQYRF